MIEKLVNGFNPEIVPNLVKFIWFTIWVTLGSIISGLTLGGILIKYRDSLKTNGSVIKSLFIIVLSVIIGILGIVAKICLLASLVIIVMSIIYKL